MRGRIGVSGAAAIAVACLLALVVPATAAQAVIRPALRQCDDLQATENSRSQCPSLDRYPHQYMIGDSITRKAKGAVENFNPHMTVDALDGRSWMVPGRPNGTTTWQAVQQVLPGLRSKDWLVMETSIGNVTVAMNKWWMDRLISEFPHNACLAWVLPHTYYDTQTDAQTAAMKKWNAQMVALITGELAKVPCHAAIDWPTVVETLTAQTPNQTPAQIKAFEPACYDGRHPTPFGARIYGSTIASTLKMATGAHTNALVWPRYFR